MFPRWLLWPLFALFMGFAIGGSFVSALQQPIPHDQSEPAKANDPHDQSSKPAANASTLESSSKGNKKSHWYNDFSEHRTDWLLVIFNCVLAFFTARLFYATSGQVAETRRIGEAQVRAYVDVQEVGISFVGIPNMLHKGFQEAQPVITITARNTGQSPARNFVWNPTLQYFSTILNIGRTRQLGTNWRYILGVGIPVGENHIDQAMIDGMPLVSFLGDAGKIDATSIFVRLRVQFEFEDVFSERIIADAFFFGSIARTPQSVATHPFHVLWSGRLTRMHRPKDWPENIETD